jgi:hypothetical protein
MNKQRLNLQCWYDDREYTYLVPLDSKAKIIVECPYCHRQASIDLDPIRKPYKATYKGGEMGESALGDLFDFSQVILTEALET